jgi:ubiquinone/menaquinone biosynthesis C-methylase UbiE
LYDLDVGCGGKPRGRVNVEPYVARSEERQTDDQPLVKRAIPNLVVACAEYLPFKDEVFDSVFSSETIEHVNSPWLMLKELVRISRSRITLIVPFYLGDYIAHNPWHKHSFNKKTVLAALHKLGCRNIEMLYTKFREYPNSLVPLLKIPLEMTVDVWKT